jgi:hypothetical protein
MIDGWSAALYQPRQKVAFGAYPLFSYDILSRNTMATLSLVDGSTRIRAFFMGLLLERTSNESVFMLTLGNCNVGCTITDLFSQAYCSLYDRANLLRINPSAQRLVSLQLQWNAM